ncbi:hypothetical protein SSPS47_13560 [Streptomyces sp. S4.7]|uniref:hypothetical protein n=1 Tax=Streptomyces sp. S4.7 TaxID=2705439 RepID=UPI0013971D00|nr:hypothetical protein [Streptomyces sp. S4.7]QHY96144.1 hypothetical protein SSPS47_13560 [Streptomyces sp. S4.7]
MQSSQRRIVRTAPLPAADESVSRPQHSDLFLEAQYTIDLPPLDEEEEADPSTVTTPYRGRPPHVAG